MPVITHTARGCEDPEVARQRASEIVVAAFGPEQTYWSAMAEQLLAALLTTAAHACCDPSVLATAIAAAPGGSNTACTVRAVATHAWQHAGLAAA